jgi:hypothetical protein
MICDKCGIAKRQGFAHVCYHPEYDNVPAGGMIEPEGFNRAEAEKQQAARGRRVACDYDKIQWYIRNVIAPNIRCLGNIFNDIKGPFPKSMYPCQCQGQLGCNRIGYETATELYALKCNELEAQYLANEERIKAANDAKDI